MANYLADQPSLFWSEERLRDDDNVARLKRDVRRKIAILQQTPQPKDSNDLPPVDHSYQLSLVAGREGVQSADFYHGIENGHVLVVVHGLRGCRFTNNAN